jgi:predicted GNAT family acetyltransferase
MDVNVRDVAEASRYEALDGKTVAAYAKYEDRGDVRVFTHTVTESEYEGEGVGSTLIRSALDDTRAKGRKIQPDCPFVKAFVDKHPDYQDLVAESS